MQDIVNFFNRVLPVLQALIAGGVIKSNSGIVIANLIGDVEAVAKGAQNPTPALIGQVEQLLKDLSVNGIIQGKFIDELNSDMAQFNTFVTAITSKPVAQPGIGPRENLFGVPGSWVYIADACEAAVKDPVGL